MNKQKVYIVIDDWARDDDYGNAISGVYINKQDAQEEYNLLVEDDKTNGLFSKLSEEDIINDYFVSEGDGYFEVY